MIKKLDSRAESNNAVDIMRWLNFTTFDITGDLTFDESFDSLLNEDYNSWVANIFSSVRVLSILQVLRGNPVIGVPAMRLLKAIPALARLRHNHISHTKERVSRRLQSKTDRKDFMR